MYREWTEAGEGWWVSDSRTHEVIKIFSLYKSQIRGATRQSSIYKSVLAMIVARGAKDFGDQRTPISDAGDSSVHDHHIFPQKYLHNYGIKGTQANSALNRTPILGKTNEEISAFAPRKYLHDDTNITGTPLLQVDLDRHCIDKEIASETFSEAVFDMFLEDRQNRIYATIQHLLQLPKGELSPPDDD